MSERENPGQLSIQEANAANVLTLALREFLKLPRDDRARQEFETGIQTLQYMILAGPGIRLLNELNGNIAATYQPDAGQQSQPPQSTTDVAAVAEAAPARKPRRRSTKVDN